MQPWYATREDVKEALDYKDTARSNRQVDRAVAAASRSVEKVCHRRFYPEIDTRYFNWPDGARPWRLWLDDNELISVTSLSSGGTAIDATDYFLEPNRSGPPYSRIEIDLDSSAAFGGGPTHQRDITITGLWAGADIVETTAADLDGNITSTATSIATTTAPLIGVGSLLRIGTERLIVTERSMSDTFVDLAADLGAANQSVTIQGVSAGFSVGETILIDSERMLIVDKSPTALTVKRAWDGSVLAAHTSGTGINALRTLTVRRGVLGTTAAAHTSGDDVLVWEPPEAVRTYVIAKAIATLTAERSGYSRTKRSGESGSNSERGRDGSALATAKDDVYDTHGRKARIRAV
jgi:hypothetical protein